MNVQLKMFSLSAIKKLLLIEQCTWNFGHKIHNKKQR